MKDERKLSADDLAPAAPVLEPGDMDGYRTKWSAIQTGFGDDARHTVEEADVLAAGVVRRLVERLAAERGRLEAMWERNDTVSKEDLREAMRRYRWFFDRLLSA